MEKYLNKGIKEIITEFPAIGALLEEFDIGCVPCNVGTCLLKDIVDVHNLSREQEDALMYKMAKVIYPDREVNQPVAKIVAMPKPKELSYSPPMKILVDEHNWIKRFLAVVPALTEKFDIYSAKHVARILAGVDFIRSYADKFHHVKEEDILFKYFDESLDIIQAMHQDHNTARNHVKAIITALEKKDQKAVVEHLNDYKKLLMAHIKKEDEILYPWMDRNLTITKVGELFSKFQQAENTLSTEQKQRFKNKILQLEETFLIAGSKAIRLNS